MVKSQINDNKSGEKKVYIEVLRGLATIAVVFLHVVMTLVANYSVEEIGVYNYAIFNDCLLQYTLLLFRCQFVFLRFVSVIFVVYYT